MMQAKWFTLVTLLFADLPRNKHGTAFSALKFLEALFFNRDYFCNAVVRQPYMLLLTAGVYTWVAFGRCHTSCKSPSLRL